MLAVVAVLVWGAVAVLSGRAVVIRRGKTSRQQLQQKVGGLQRYVIFPEGTRRASASDASEPGELRVGGLKNIFESGPRSSSAPEQILARSA